MNRHTGISRLELVIVIIVLATLLGIGLDRYNHYQHQAEAQAEQAVLVGLQRALLQKGAEVAFRQGASQVNQLQTANPFDLLQVRPNNYAGPLPANGTAWQAGAWYHDPARHAIAYLPRHAQPGPADLRRYQVQVVHGAGGADGIRLQPLSPHTP